MAVNAIGVISGILTIVGFLEDNFGSGDVSGSTIRVAVGLEGRDGEPPTDTGGDLPDIRVWNNNGVFTGITADPGSVGGGNVGSVEVSHDNQNVYSLFSANNDAICVAWVTVENSDDRGGNRYAVSGDYGKECGGTWYASGMFPTSDTEYEPPCFWIDGDGDQPKTGFQVRWPAFSGDAFDENDTDPQKFCNDIDFGLREEDDPNTINFWTRKARKAKTKRVAAAPARAQWMASQLVISDAKTNSALELCGSATSLGPDFAHTGEGKFCDMGDKKLYGLCGDGVSDDCFDLEARALAPKSVRRGGVLPRLVSPYALVRDWRKNGTASR
ncbi:uncharacterized protein PG986_014033 [Apiospora aurea]|uniref:Uncharacterized protein n=1 Tax=Apiospora aurea TaxID=335848 RepID=A0ABR1PXU3_9PEZI